MYGTVTVLTPSTAAHIDDVAAELESLVSDVASAPALVAVYVLVTDPGELVMVTLYRSEADAEALSAQVRPRLGATVGRHLAAPPQRYAGPVILAGGAGSHQPDR
jgi:hypothetical protein